MHLHGGFSNANIVGNLLVQATGRDLDHDLTLAGTQSLETLSERVEGFVTLAPGTIASEAGPYRIKELLITERFCRDKLRTRR
jgi:hypothetical protein